MSTILYSLGVFFFYYLFCRSAILARPRAALVKTFPRLVGGICACPFCFTFWVSLVILSVMSIVLGDIVFDTAVLFASPVINYFLGLMSDALIRYNTPPVVMPAVSADLSRYKKPRIRS